MKSIYDSDEATTYDVGDGFMMVQPFRASMLAIVVPAGDAKPDHALAYQNEPRSRAQFANLLRNATYGEQQTVTLGELSAWVNRRRGHWLMLSCESCGDQCGCGDRVSDWQLVLGVPIQRHLVREAIQELYERRLPASAEVSIGHMPQNEYRCLAMRCGDWCAAVMQGKLTEEMTLGDDPFPVALSVGPHGAD
jgi:hypothetical protein